MIVKAYEYSKKNSEKMTASERIIEKILTEYNYDFKSQKVIDHSNGFYIIDFYICCPHKLCIEIDGNQHLGKRIDYDVKRTLFLECDKELNLLRFRNDEVSDTQLFRTWFIYEIEQFNPNRISVYDDLTKEYFKVVA